MKYMNFGCGPDQPKGWVNTDRLGYGQSDQYNILDYWPYEDDSFDVITTNHVLHMFSWNELGAIVIPQFLRVLKPGGVLRVIDMDPVTAFHYYQHGMDENLIIPEDVEPSLDGKFCQYLTWYGTRKSIATGNYMAELLTRYGFSESAVVSFGQTNYPDLKKSVKLDSREDESYFVEAKK